MIHYNNNIIILNIINIEYYQQNIKNQYHTNIIIVSQFDLHLVLSKKIYIIVNIK